MPGATNCWPAGRPPGAAVCEHRLDRGHQRADQGHEAYGFRNFDNYGLRLLLTVGLDLRTVDWQAWPAALIRGRTTLGGVEPCSTAASTGRLALNHGALGGAS